MTSKGDFDAGVDEGDILASDRLLDRGDDAEVSSRQIFAAVDRHGVHRSLTLQRYSDRQQQVAIDNSKHRRIRRTSANLRQGL